MYSGFYIPVKYTFAYYLFPQGALYSLVLCSNEWDMVQLWYAGVHDLQFFTQAKTILFLRLYIELYCTRHYRKDGQMPINPIKCLGKYNKIYAIEFNFLGGFLYFIIIKLPYFGVLHSLSAANNFVSSMFFLNRYIW